MYVFFIPSFFSFLTLNVHQAPLQVDHSALLQFSAVNLLFFNPTAKQKEPEMFGKILITDLLLHDVGYHHGNEKDRAIHRTLSNTSSASSSRSSRSGYFFFYLNFYVIYYCLLISVSAILFMMFCCIFPVPSYLSIRTIK